ncbi:MAG: hypothetical protein HOB86_00880 [Rhodospirillaceae bacterium]|nr:hypothetical protein [Rhodospirillaceae bacterium]
MLDTVLAADTQRASLLAEAETATDPGRIADIAIAGERIAAVGDLATASGEIVIDGAGNAAGLSLSNGEGSSYLVPETGIMLNNMLGEEDLNPGGFHQWAEDTRICSMMAPTLIEEASGILTIMGSGGSNRIRTAILQVLINLLEHDMRIETAVTSPRIHVEGGTLSAEDGFDGTDLEMAADGDTVEAWDGVNLFFGGVHAVRHDPARGHYSGAGDPRRGGVSSIL